MDEDTKKVLTDLENIKRTTETPGWEIITARLNGLIEDLCDIRNVDATDREERLHQLEVRASAAEIVDTWMKKVQDEAAWSDKINKETEESTSSKIYVNR